MARNRTAAVANQVAYDLGYNGVTLTKALVDGHIEQGDELEWRKRRQVLSDRVRSADIHHLWLIVVGGGVFVAAIVVDFFIIHEYWANMLSNEFGEVAPGRVWDVFFKSMQVLFATLAIHFLISPRNGEVSKTFRWMYSVFIFVATVAMLVSIGVVWANSNMPSSTRIFVGEATESAQVLGQFARAMEVESPLAQAAMSSNSYAVQWLRDNESTIRLVSLGIIFLIVASIGAFALDCAIRAFAARSGGAIFDNYEEATLGRRLNAEYASFAAEDPTLPTNGLIRGYKKPEGNQKGISELGAGPPARDRQDLMGEFVRSYTAGVLDRQLDSVLATRMVATTGSADRLLKSLSSAVGAREQPVSAPSIERAPDPKVTPFVSRI